MAFISVATVNGQVDIGVYDVCNRDVKKKQLISKHCCHLWFSQDHL